MKTNTHAFLRSPSNSLTIKTFLLTSVLLLLGINFTGSFLGHTYFSDSLLQVQSAGFWIFISTFVLLLAIVLWNKKVLGWTWSELGLGKPENWWQPILIAIALYGVSFLFITYAAPHIVELGNRPNISHLMALRGNLPLLLFALVMVWITAAFLEELIFRAYLINVLDRLFGKTLASAEIAVVISAVVFGLLHAYQGITGILLTGCIGFIFGIFYLLNGRRIWPLILIHGLIDTISLISIYKL